MKITYRKTSKGNYVGRCGRYYIFIYKRPHGKWCSSIAIGNYPVFSEGYFTTYLNTVKKAKDWVKNKLNVN